MKRKMICLSSPATVVVAVMMLGSPAVAQDPTPPPASDVHVVREGETLWALAAFYLGDPLLWPEIYRINTMVIEDPHWIFPGEELRLAGAPDATAVAQTPDQPVTPVDEPPPAPVTPAPPVSNDAPTIFARNRRPTGSRVAVISGPEHRPITRAQFYSAGFLTEEEDLPWAEVLGATDQTTLASLTEASSAFVYEVVRIRSPGDVRYQVGDTLMVARLPREVPRWGDVVIPSGLVVVSRVSERDVEALVLQQYHMVADGQVAMPIEPFTDLMSSTTVPVENGIEGEIIAQRDLNVVPNQQDIVFIDLGREDGVSLGDVFEVVLPREGISDVPDRRVALMRIVNVRNQSASGFIYGIFDLGIEAGATVRMIRQAS